ncbi:MAG: ISKra4 family transposase [Acidobacteria bacterium]|nr:ISKra4 family transposase [Acidobacteriota bacterium]
MRAACMDCPPVDAPYAAAEAAFAQAKAYLSSRDAQHMSESDLERELHRRGQELMRKLLQGHLEQRSPGEAAGPVEGADGVARSERRVHARHLETIFGTVQVERVGYASPGHDSLHPLDAALNLPPERYSLEVRRRVAAAAASRSFDETLFDLARTTGAEVPKRQAEALVVRAAQDFDAFYEARREEDGQPPPTGGVIVLTFDGKGVVMHRDDLRAATRKAAERRRQKKEKLSRLFKRLKKGEKKHSKRMATVAAVYAVAPFVRSPEEFLRSLMPPQPGATPRGVRARPVAKRVWASIDKEPWEVIAEATLEAERQDPEHATRWIALVDGAETQLALVEEITAMHDVEVTVVIDIIHVAEYVWKAAHVFHREGSPELECWAWTRVRSILEGKASQVAGAMRRAATIAGFSSGERKRVDTCADYLVKYAPYLHYDRYLAAGYPIATGVIEGACRYLVRDRMELTGARWRLVGAEAVLKLRALRASGDFDAYWDYHEAREYQRNHAERYADGAVTPVKDLLPPPSTPRLRRVK